MMWRFACSLLLCLFALVPATRAEGPVVVELFTSQGCSSCPPADAYLAELAENPDVLTLAFHVDYWDRLGWKDTFASRDNTNRQYAYGRAFHNRSVWTPQFVVQGRHFSKGNFRAMVAEYIANAAAAGSDVDLSVARSDMTAEVTLSGRGAAATLYLVTYKPSADVRVKRGENAGRTLSYHSIVTGLEPLGNWDGRGTESFTVTLSDGAHMAVILQDKKLGPIQAAARLN